MSGAPEGDSESLLRYRFLRFLLVGGFAAIVNFGSRFVYSLFVEFGAAVILAVFTGMATAYVLNKRYVFTASKNSRAHEISWFIAINMLALVQTWGLSVYLAPRLPQYLALPGQQGLAMAEAIAHGAGIILPVFTSYLGHKYLSFRE